MKIRAYPLYDQAVAIEPAPDERAWAAEAGAVADLALSTANGIGWELRCPYAFEATWNGGPAAEDIDIRIDAPDDNAPAFVQSYLGAGLLTFHTGYQLQTEAPHSLWVRSPINRPKDGLYPLESIVDTSLMPCTINVTWKFTHPFHTIRFEQGEPFGAILPYAGSTQESVTLDVVQLDADAELEAYEQALQQLVDSAAVQSVFQHMGAVPAETAHPETRGAHLTVEPAPVKLAYLIIAHHQPNHLARLIQALDDENSFFFIHIDGKVALAPFQAVVPVRENITFLQNRVAVEWGKLNVVRAVLNLIRAAAASGHAFKYFTVLSGSDYPIKHKQEIYSRLQASDCQFLRIDRKLTNETTHSHRHLIEQLPQETYSGDLAPYHGSLYWSLTADCIRYILDFVDNNPGHVEIHRNLLAPDEVFFYAIVKHSPFAGAISHDFSDGIFPDLTHHANHSIDWAGLRQRKELILDERDSDDLLASPALFAREFDEQTSSKLLDFLDARIHLPGRSVPLGRRPVAAEPHYVREDCIDVHEKVLIAYNVKPRIPMRLARAPAAREWIDLTTERFANRCLPLLIANQSGWFILNNHELHVIWTGGNDCASVQIEYLSGVPPYPAQSHFGHGILTWTIPFLFRTPPGYNLLVRGPANWPKDGIYPLDGVVEADWATATFTMNWKLTRTNSPVIFNIGEPICMIVPQRRGELEAFRPEIHDIASDPATQRGYQQWSRSRARFLTDLRVPGSESVRRGWQKQYFQGVSADGRAVPEHQTKLKLQEFVEANGHEPITQQRADLQDKEAL